MKMRLFWRLVSHSHRFTVESILAVKRGERDRFVCRLCGRDVGKA